MTTQTDASGALGRVVLHHLENSRSFKIVWWPPLPLAARFLR
jgi:hypothetical protein